MFRYRLKIVLLSLGAIAGFASAYRHLGHGHGHSHDHFCAAPWQQGHGQHGRWDQDDDRRGPNPPAGAGAAAPKQVH